MNDIWTKKKDVIEEGVIVAPRERKSPTQAERRKQTLYPRQDPRLPWHRDLYIFNTLKFFAILN